MKRFSSLVIALPILLAACAGGGSDAPSVTTSTGEDDLNILEIKCRDSLRVSGGARLDVQPVSGALQATLLTNEGEAVLVCHASHVASEKGPRELVVSCVEQKPITRVGEEHPSNWGVEIRTASDGTQSAHIERHEITGVRVRDEDLACSRIAAEVPVLPYSVVSGYIHRTCDVCHGDRFDSLAKVREQRDLMFGVISEGYMPKRNPGWREQDEGKLTLSFLANSPELE